MGATENSLLSWEGKVHDNPKPFGKISEGQDPIKYEQLADFEKDLLTMINEIAENREKEGGNGIEK